jgi:hypothetical protein
MNICKLKIRFFLASIYSLGYGFYLICSEKKDHNHVKNFSDCCRLHLYCYRHEKLLGIFSVNLAHNLIHLLSGVLALICGFSSKKASRSYFVLFGLTYGAIAALGFYHGDEMLLGMIANNQAASWLHLGITILFLIIGFFL